MVLLMERQLFGPTLITWIMRLRIIYLLACLTLTAGCKPSGYASEWASVKTANGIQDTAVDYGYGDDDELYFVVFRNGQKISDKAHLAPIRGNDACADCYISLQDGKRIPLESSHRIFDFTNDSFSQYPIMCSRSDLESYIRNKNEGNLFTFTGLTNYLAKKRP
jgi:hypothetical protein